MRFSIFAAVVFASVAAASASAEVMYTVTDLGLGKAYAISQAGHAAGMHYGVDYGYAVITAIDGKFTDTTSTLGWPDSCAYSVNSSGEAVGIYYSSHSSSMSFPCRMRIGEEMTRPTSATGAATSISENGDFVGYYDNAFGQYGFKIDRDGQFHSLTACRPNGINDQGQIAGTISSGSFRTQPGGGVEHSPNLGTVPGVTGASSVAFAINSLGQVVGGTFVESFGGPFSSYHAFRTAPQGYLSEPGCVLDMLPGDIRSEAYGINNFGDTVGSSASFTRRRAFLSQGSASTVIDLNAAIDPSSGWYLEWARGINDRGQIVGWGTYNGEEHAFRLDPVPEPSSLVPFAFGTFAVLRKR